MDTKQAQTRLQAALGHRPLNRRWAKWEILLGLLAAAFGGFLGCGRVPGFTEASWLTLAPALMLVVLGIYLAMAGHRSHLYQSSNELTAYLAELVQGGRS